MLSVMGIAALGAALQELVHWYTLRGRLSDPEYASEIRSASYWIITVLMILGAGAGTTAWYYDQSQHTTTREYLLMGAAFPTLFKKLVQALLVQQSHQRGKQLGTRPRPSRVATYFG